ncbi:MAG: hypothetical protein IH861_11660 [Chloroflexi bacterium]|nr:hypothetical protein [Chloroflexota bacterium]
MSIFLLNKTLYLPDNEAEFRKRMRDNAEEAVRRSPLAGYELEAPVTGDGGGRITFDRARAVPPP